MDKLFTNSSQISEKNSNCSKLPWDPHSQPHPFPSLPSGITSDNRGLRVIDPCGNDGRLRVCRRRVLLVLKATSPSSSLCRWRRRAVRHLCCGQRRREAGALLEAAVCRSSAGGGWSAELSWMWRQGPVAEGAAKRIANQSEIDGHKSGCLEASKQPVEH